MLTFAQGNAGEVLVRLGEDADVELLVVGTQEHVRAEASGAGLSQLLLPQSCKLPGGSGPAEYPNSPK
jgi:hypothetical protein